MTSIPTILHAVSADPAWAEWAAALPPLATLAGRDRGAIVTDQRTSFVRRHATPRGQVFVKVYEYTTWRARLRDFGRRTGPWAVPRAVREFQALEWLRQHGFAAPRPLLAAVARRWGFVARAVLVTAAWPGERADTVLAQLDTPRRTQLVAAIEQLLRDLHARGFRDRNFDLRNLLVAPDGDGWTVAKIDSPRHRLVAPGATDDRLARADWRRLRPQLAAFASPR